MSTKHFGFVVVLVALIALTSPASATTDKLPLCHVPPGNPANAHIIYPDDHSYDAHIVGGHGGDFLVYPGMTCPATVETTPTETPTQDVTPTVEITPTIETTPTETVTPTEIVTETVTPTETIIATSTIPPLPTETPSTIVPTPTATSTSVAPIPTFIPPVVTSPPTKAPARAVQEQGPVVSSAPPVTDFPVTGSGSTDDDDSTLEIAFAIVAIAIGTGGLMLLCRRSNR